MRLSKNIERGKLAIDLGSTIGTRDWVKSPFWDHCCSGGRDGSQAPRGTCKQCSECGRHGDQDQGPLTVHGPYCSCSVLHILFPFGRSTQCLDVGSQFPEGLNWGHSSDSAGLVTSPPGNPPYSTISNLKEKRIPKYKWGMEGPFCPCLSPRNPLSFLKAIPQTLEYSLCAK